MGIRYSVEANTTRRKIIQNTHTRTHIRRNVCYNRNTNNNNSSSSHMHISRLTQRTTFADRRSKLVSQLRATCVYAFLLLLLAVPRNWYFIIFFRHLKKTGIHFSRVFFFPALLPCHYCSGIAQFLSENWNCCLYVMQCNVIAWTWSIVNRDVQFLLLLLVLLSESAVRYFHTRHIQFLMSRGCFNVWTIQVSAPQLFLSLNLSSFLSSSIVFITDQMNAPEYHAYKHPYCLIILY